MHYIEQGTGEPIVFIHGNPTWSYLWRNILPHLVPYGRCIAVDLIGYGRSDKPHIQYKWTDQRKYVEEFFRKMGLKHVLLVLHDWGVSLGLSYAMRHESNVRAIAFMEGIFRPFPQWKDFSTPEFRQLFQTFRVGNEGGQGWQLLVEQNFFIEHLLSGGVGRPLDAKEMSFYREPFIEKRSRIPIWQLARSVPVEGEPKDVWVAISDITEKLKRSKLPKILFHAQPGGIITEENVEWCKQNLPNLETVFLGPGVHYVQETTPHLIGRELARWYQDLGKGRSEDGGLSAGHGNN
jgi:haloalkane dehalogenase